MNVLVGKSGPKQYEGTEVVTQRCSRMAMILSLSILGVAGTYYGILYLIAH